MPWATAAGHRLGDCGFGTFAGSELVAEEVVWAKLKTCREGAELATRRLWGRP
jgi:5-methyltetrahydropteroyltriglutamate--homocysteine methyltransferase